MDLYADEPTFLGDTVSLDEHENTITFRHCGVAACSLARKDAGPVVACPPYRQIGPAMDFGCAATANAAVSRVGRKADGSFRFFILGGAVLDKPKQFTGTSLVVRTDAPACRLWNAAYAPALNRILRWPAAESANLWKGWLKCCM